MDEHKLNQLRQHAEKLGVQGAQSLDWKALIQKLMPILMGIITDLLTNPPVQAKAQEAGCCDHTACCDAVICAQLHALKLAMDHREQCCAE
jgi:hypothetical protein